MTSKRGDDTELGTKFNRGGHVKNARSVRRN